MNETIETRGHTTREGMLNLSVDVGIADADVEVSVQVKPMRQPSSNVSVPASNDNPIRRRSEKLDFSRERKWLDAHMNEYAGQWVALKGENLLANGESGSEVYKAALAKGVKDPFVIRVESGDELPFGGW